MSSEHWQQRVAAVWDDTSLTAEQVLERIDALAGERPADDALALFERAGARDSAGIETEAERLYRAALAAGLPENERIQAVIQLASTLRNLGRAEDGLALLAAESGRTDEWAGAVAAFTALALASAGREREAVATALDALVPHLPRYHRSVRAYAAELRSESR